VSRERAIGRRYIRYRDGIVQVARAKGQGLAASVIDPSRPRFGCRGGASGHRQGALVGLAASPWKIWRTRQTTPTA
jgi:hypothetical protein